MSVSIWKLFPCGGGFHVGFHMEAVSMWRRIPCRFPYGSCFHVESDSMSISIWKLFPCGGGFHVGFHMEAVSMWRRIPCRFPYGSFSLNSINITQTHKSTGLLTTKTQLMKANLPETIVLIHI